MREKDLPAGLFNIVYNLSADPDSYVGDRLRRLKAIGIGSVAIRANGDCAGWYALADRCTHAGLALAVVSAAHGPERTLAAVGTDAIRTAQRHGVSMIRVETPLLDRLETSDGFDKALQQLRELESALQAVGNAEIRFGFEPSREGSMTSEAARDLFHVLDSRPLGVSVNPSKLVTPAMGPESSVSGGEHLRYNLRRFLSCYFFSGHRMEDGQRVRSNLWNADSDFVDTVFRMHFSRDTPPRHIVVEDHAIEHLLDGQEQGRFYIMNSLSAMSEFSYGHPALKKGDRNLANQRRQIVWGKAELTPDRIYPVASHASYTIRITVGSGGIGPGGEIRLQEPALWNAGRMQTSFPEREGYVTVSSSSSTAELRLFTRPYPLAELNVSVADGRLVEGDVLLIRMGDTDAGSPGIITNEDLVDVTFAIGVRRSSDSDLAVMADAPVLRIGNGHAANLTPVVPSIVEPGEAVPLILRADDDVGYPCRGPGELAYTGVVGISMQAAGANSIPVPVEPGCIELEETDAGVKRLSVAHGGGVVAPGNVCRIVVQDRDDGITGHSNPISFRNAPDCRLFWGDIHSHSVESDGRLSIDFLYQYARDYAGLDFASSGDHSFANSAQKWDIAKEHASRYNEPQRFVTLLGTEFSKPAPYGDRNAYFKTLDVPSFAGNDIQDIWDWVAENGGMLIPHQLASPPMAIDWQYHDPRVERLVEIASCHGNFEKPDMPYGFSARYGIWKGSLAEGSFYQDALARRYHLGVIGSSDTHDTHTGHTPYGSWRGTPLAAVWAPELTREAIFEAMWNRRCYATSGARIILEVWVDGEPMGSEIERAASNASPIHVQASVVGTAELETVDIVRNNRDVHTIEPQSEQATIEFDDDLSDLVDTAEVYYYLRVRQIDGEMAWSSPVWIGGEQWST